MKTTKFRNLPLIHTFASGAALLLVSFVLFTLGCAKDSDVALDQVNLADPSEELSSRATTFAQYNLVSDQPEAGAVRLDTNLRNAWGIAMGPGQDFWITSAHADRAVMYNQLGNTVRPPIEIEGDPIGIVYNPSSGFRMPGSTNIARYIFATEEGQIAAWTPWKPNEVTTVIDNSAGGSGYTGLEIAKDKGSYFIYAANVAQGTIDVYDKNWNLVTNKPFADPNLADGMSPFNIRQINNLLYVTYVGPGDGVVNVFKTDGTFVKRFATGGTLAAPWGITRTPGSFGLGSSILVGNFGDGTINIYDLNGNYKGQMTDSTGDPIAIDGLWALTFTDKAMSGGVTPRLYFTAGPDDEEHGLFGYLQKQ